MQIKLLYNTTQNQKPSQTFSSILGKKQIKTEKQEMIKDKYSLFVFFLIQEGKQ